MAYTPPAGNAVDFSWVGAAAYTPPAGDAVSFSFAPSSPSGTFAGTVAISGAFAGTTIDTITGEFAGAIAVYGEVVGGHGVAATEAAQILPSGSFSGAVGTAGQCAGAVGIAGAFAGIHERYEVRGEVRDSGILVDRRVRVYNRATGALIDQADTVGGQFAIHVGFDEIETCVLPIDLSSGAVDFSPPCANRVMAVLAGT